MIKLDSNNAFIGAKVKYQGKDFFILKVNEKSLYMTISKEDVEHIEKKPKGLTFKEFCTRREIKMYKYEGIEIDEEEAKKKVIVEKIIENKKSNTVLSKELEKEIKMLYKRKFEKKDRRSIWSPIYSNKGDRAIIISAVPGGKLLLNINDNYYFYYLDEEKIFPFKKEIHKDGKNICWPQTA